MELMETVELLKLLSIPYPFGDRATVFKELCTIKPLKKLVKLRGDWSELVGRRRFEKLAKCSEHKFLINHKSAQIPRFPFSLSPRML